MLDVLQIYTFISKTASPTAEGKEEPSKEDLPLGEGVLTVNLGIPLVFLCTKADVIQSNEKNIFTEQSVPLLLKTIRTNALLCIVAFLFIRWEHYSICFK